MRRNRVDARFYIALVIAAVITFAVHEAAHWAAGVALGHDMVISLNGVAGGPGVELPVRDAFIVTAAGPAVTVLQALVAFALIRSRGALLAYPFLFAAWFMRFAAAFVSVSHPNDEASMSLQLGWGQWLLPITTVLALLVLTWLGARRLRLGWTTNTTSYVLCSLLFAAIVFGDAAL